jgi:2',3'-cyclic-nucleotide 2'-phosphodiesterase (5'-nucleotidase family)
MNKFKKLMLGALAVALMTASCATSDDDDNNTSSTTDDAFTLQLLHFSDVDGNEESALDSVDEFSALVNAFKSDATYGANTLFVSSGDHIIQGPRFYAAEQDAVENVTDSNEPGHADIALMNAMGVHAANVGNHDLDAGPGELADAIYADNASTAEFPHLSANIDFSSEPDFTIGTNGDNVANMRGQVAGYAIATIGGESIGIVGAATPTLSTITSIGDLVISPSDTSATAAEIAAAIQPAVDLLEEQGVNKIVVLAHMQQIAVEKAMAEALDGVDIIVAGGSNTRMGDSNDTLFSGTYVTDSDFAESYPYQTTDASGNPTLVVNVDADYKYLGRLVVDFDNNGVIDTDSLDSTVNGAYAATSAVVAQVGGTVNSEVVAIRDAIQTVITAQYGNVVGYTDTYLDGRRSQVRTEETNLGNLSADANLWYANTLYDNGTVHVSLKNGGGLRTEIGSAVVPPGSTDYSEAVLLPPAANTEAGTAAGAVSEGHLRATLRFDNGLVLINVTGSELKDLLEHAVAATADGATPGQFPQVAGMRFTYDTTRTARTEVGNGERIRDLVIIDDNGTITPVVEDGSVVDNSNFRLVTLNFLANGGDAYPFDQLSNPDRVNLYEGAGFGESTDYPDATLTNDPGNNSSFSYTGGEQDAFAEYLKTFHPDAASAYNKAETSAEFDYHIVNLAEQTNADLTDLDASAGFQMTEVGRYESNTFDVSAAEIVAFDKDNDRLFVVNAQAGQVDVLSMASDGSLSSYGTISKDDIAAGNPSGLDNTTIAGFNSVDVKNGVVAVAVEHSTKSSNGAVAFFHADNLSFVQALPVGVLPDALLFNPAGTKVVVANEGEPLDNGTDPEGSISIIDVSDVTALDNNSVTNLTFTAYNTAIPTDVRVFTPNSTAAQDLEPEYVAISEDGNTAWVALQENNAVAIVDLSTNTLTDVKALGFKDHSVAPNELDVSNRDDKIQLNTWDNLKGMYQPDTIVSATIGGSSYYFTANEGDARDYDFFSEEARVKDVTLDATAFPTAATLQADDQLGRLKITTTLGDTDDDGDYDELYAYGARSFSIWDATGALVFDSGSELERITAQYLQNGFNSNNDENDSFDSRSDDKGPEPEAIAVGTVDSTTYAFIGLERVGGIVVYDVSTPADAKFVHYINNRDFDATLAAGVGGDLGPESLKFVSASDSPTGKALLISGNEVSGSTVVYEIQ